MIVRFGLRLNEKKCEICKFKVCCFGKVISKEGVSLDLEKVKVI